MQQAPGFPAHASQHQIDSFATPAQQYLSDCSRVLVFNEAGQVLYARDCQVTCSLSIWLHKLSAFKFGYLMHLCAQASPAELQSLQSLFGSREDALHTGILIDNKRYEVQLDQQTTHLSIIAAYCLLLIGTPASCG